MSEQPKYAVGTQVKKETGDYRFRGTVQAVFFKQSGALRYVVENADGMLFIFNEGQLEPALSATDAYIANEYRRTGGRLD